MVNQTDEKFLAVTGYSLADYQGFTSWDKFDQYKRKYKIGDFKQILTTPVDEFSEQLYYYLILTTQRQERLNAKKIYNSDSFCQDISYKEGLALALKNFLSGGKLKATITNKPKSYVLSNKRLLDLLQSAAVSVLRDTITELKLNESPLPKDLAIEEINNHSDVVWVERWMGSMGYIDPEFASFTLEKFDDYFKKLNFSTVLPGQIDSIREEMIDDYASDHPQKEEINVEELNRILARIRKIKSPAGRKEDTYIQKHTAYTLSLLLRLDRYLEDKTIKTIDMVPIENSDLRVIIDIMSFFDLFIDYRTGAKKRSGVEKRCRKMIQDFKDMATITEHVEWLQIFKIRYLQMQITPHN
jgi:hypothetical protein